MSPGRERCRDAIEPVASIGARDVTPVVEPVDESVQESMSPRVVTWREPARQRRKAG